MKSTAVSGAIVDAVRILAAFLAALLLAAPASAGKLASDSTYAANNPVKYTDPNGQIVPALVVGGVLVGIAFGAENSDNVNLAAPAAGAVVGGALAVGTTAAGLSLLPAEAAPLVTMIGTTGTGVGLALADQGTPAAGKLAAVADDAVAAAKSAGSGLARQTTEQLTKSKGSFEKLIATHEQKLKDYLKAPEKFDNKGLLKGASEELRKKIVEGRAKSLADDIAKQRAELAKVDAELAKRKETKK